MTRKDTILVAVIVNAGLLSILFITAVIYDSDRGIEHSEFVSPLVDNKSAPIEVPTNLVAISSTGDEVDNVLKYYHPPSQPLVVMPHSDSSHELPEPLTLQSSPNQEEEYLSSEFDSPLPPEYIEVKVKKGDVLEKIARANKTSVAAIKKANHLENEYLSIGQVLKIPKKMPSNTEVIQPKKVVETKPEAEAVYYVIKSGDNPWKIAKHFNVKFEDILILNNLDEEKARNLKIGDRIRVK